MSIALGMIHDPHSMQSQLFPISFNNVSWILALSHDILSTLIENSTSILHTINSIPDHSSDDSSYP